MSEVTALATGGLVTLLTLSFRSGRGPLELLHLGIIHTRAAVMCARIMALAAWKGMARYPECVDAIRRNS